MHNQKRKSKSIVAKIFEWIFVIAITGFAIMFVGMAIMFFLLGLSRSH